MPKVSILRLSSLGDILLTQPSVSVLTKAGYPVTYITQPSFQKALELFPDPVRVMLWLENHFMDPLTQESVDLTTDILFDFHGTGKARRVAGKIKSGKIFHYNKHSFERRLLVRPWGWSVPWNACSSLRAPQSVVHWYGKTLRHMGISWPKVTMKLRVPTLAKDKLEYLVKPGHLSRKLIILAPGARWQTKQWPVDYFAKLGSDLQKKHGFQPVCIGSQAEVELCSTLAKSMGGKAISLAGKTDILAMAAIIDRAQVVVANDSAPMHLSRGLGKNLICLAGPTVPEFGFLPIEEPKVRVLSRDLPCRPCSVHGSVKCPLGHHHCMKEIGVEEVHQAVISMLG
jgi:heptosyltransferase II